MRNKFNVLLQANENLTLENARLREVEIRFDKYQWDHKDDWNFMQEMRTKNEKLMHLLELALVAASK